MRVQVQRIKEEEGPLYSGPGGDKIRKEEEEKRGKEDREGKRQGGRTQENKTMNLRLVDQFHSSYPVHGNKTQLGSEEEIAYSPE